MVDCIERVKVHELIKKMADGYEYLEVPVKHLTDKINSIPAADVLPRDEAITMGAELAAMHGSDATSQQLEEAYLKGVEYGMTRRDVRPVKWTLCEEKQPPQGRYLCVKQLFNGDFSYDVCSFAEDLSKVDNYDFPENLYKGIGGWFDYDSETGYFQTSVYAWMPLPPFYNCGAEMEES